MDDFGNEIGYTYQGYYSMGYYAFGSSKWDRTDFVLYSIVYYGGSF